MIAHVSNKYMQQMLDYQFNESRNREIMTIYIGAITLTVKNLITVTAFYRDIVGLGVLDRHGEECVLGTSERPLVVLRMNRDGHIQPGRPGLYHLALRVPSRGDLAHWLTHYLSLGCPLWQGASDHGVSEAIYLTDPEGNGIEITCDSPRDEWDVRPDGKINVFARQLDIDSLLAQSPSTPWQCLPAQTNMGHIHLRVSEIPAARELYVDGLGLTLKTELPDSALFVAGGDYHHHIGLNNWQSRGAAPSPVGSLGLASFDIHFSDLSGLALAAKRLTHAGYLIRLERDDAGFATYHCVDPFGIHMVLKSDVSAK